jgi:hypothetical protein
LEEQPQQAWSLACLINPVSFKRFLSAFKYYQPDRVNFSLLYGESPADPFFYHAAPDQVHRLWVVRLGYVCRGGFIRAARVRMIDAHQFLALGFHLVESSQLFVRLHAKPGWAVQFIGDWNGGLR